MSWTATAAVPCGGVARVGSAAACPQHQRAAAGPPPWHRQSLLPSPSPPHLNHAHSGSPPTFQPAEHLQRSHPHNPLCDRRHRWLSSVMAAPWRGQRSYMKHPSGGHRQTCTPTSHRSETILQRRKRACSWRYFLPASPTRVCVAVRCDCRAPKLRPANGLHRRIGLRSRHGGSAGIACAAAHSYGAG